MVCRPAKLQRAPVQNLLTCVNNGVKQVPYCHARMLALFQFWSVISALRYALQYMYTL